VNLELDMELKMNIPIYRAKKICRDDYAEGYLLESSVIISKKNIAKDVFLPIIVDEIDIIDTSTLAIHFQDMIDSEGNKIFASLNEDGKGGDIVSDKSGNEFSVLFKNNLLCFVDLMDSFLEVEYETKWCKVMGIQQ